MTSLYELYRACRRCKLPPLCAARVALMTCLKQTL